MFSTSAADHFGSSSISYAQLELLSGVQEEILRILRQHDEESAYEFPKGFDYATLERQAGIVNRRLNEELGERTTLEGALHNQDASFSIAVGLNNYERPADIGLYLPYIRFSNFGNLVSITWPELIPVEQLESIIRILNEEGFTFLSEDELDCPYDGVMPGKFETWWIRYFDWL